MARLGPEQPIPAWAVDFFAVTRTRDELSIVCGQAAVPLDVAAECGFRMLMVEGPLDFSMTGILASITTSLADAGVSLFAISTYDTDYVLVRDDRFQSAVAALRAGGWDVDYSGP